MNKDLVCLIRFDTVIQAVLKGHLDATWPQVATIFQLALTI